MLMSKKHTGDLQDNNSTQSHADPTFMWGYRIGLTLITIQIGVTFKVSYIRRICSKFRKFYLNTLSLY